VVRAQGPEKRNGEIGDIVQSARPAFWPISLLLAVTRPILAIVTGVRCSLSYSFRGLFSSDLIGRRESNFKLAL
jgi:hypothetical protein